MVARRALAACLLFSVIACGHAAGLPYATMDGKCIDETALAAAINGGTLSADAKTKAIDGCKLACSRVLETIEKIDKSSGTDNCQKTAEKLYQIMEVMTYGPFDSKLVNDNLHFLFLKQNAAGYPLSCMQQIEIHWKNREKFCVPSLDSTAYDASTNKYGANLESMRSATRQFVIKFMHKGSSQGWCLETMYNIVKASYPYASNGFLTVDKGGKCPSILKTKWGTTCSPECKTQMNDAVKVASKRSMAWKAPESDGMTSDHEPDCCMASYYDEFMDFTYGNSHYDKDNSKMIPGGTALPSGCSTDSLPCTTVDEAMSACKLDYKYTAYKCYYGAGAGQLTASLLMAVGAALATLMVV